MSIRIMNLKHHRPVEPYDKVIDRSTPIGNPFTMRNKKQRNMVCNSYAMWFTDAIDCKSKLVMSYLDELAKAYKRYGQLRLFCWCAPERCHGETIRKYILKK